MKRWLNVLLKYWPILSVLAAMLLGGLITAIKLSFEIKDAEMTGRASDRRLDILEQRLIKLETIEEMRRSGYVLVTEYSQGSSIKGRQGK